jgi:sugar lactone lactonase YvrE
VSAVRNLREGGHPGRLLRRTADGAVETVLGGLAFADGVALSPSGDAVLVAESATRRICRVATDGEGAGRLVVRAPERLKPGPRRSVRVLALTEDA